jgi:DNA repair protein RecO (recombination protein O)
VNRTASYNALVLRVRPSGEHREAAFLTAEEGIIRATVFGGPKSRFRAHVSPFNSGTLLIYRDPVKDTRKVSDFDVASWRPGLRELYERSEAAARLAAAVLGSSGGGGAWSEALAGAVATLDALETADEDCCARLLVRFLWVWAGFLGQKPGLERCSSCACEVRDDGLLWFIRGEGLLCAMCRKQEGRDMPGNSGAPVLGPGARRWLAAAETHPASEMRRMSLDSASLGEAKAVAEALLQN